MTTYNLSKILRGYSVTASTPVRIDCGGSLDQRLVSSLLAGERPCTVNFAVNLRTQVNLYPYKQQRIRIESSNFGGCEVSWPDLDFTSEFGLVFAIISHFQVTGVRIEIKSSSPVLSGLGGSGSLAVALIAALSETLDLLDKPKLSKWQIVKLAHNLEDSLYQNTGFQDQLVACYAGISLWHWEYIHKRKPKRQRLIAQPQELNSNILLAYTGKPHPISTGGSRVAKALREKNPRDTFIQLIKNTQRFAQAIIEKDYNEAAQGLLKEGELREALVEKTYSPEGLVLVNNARKFGCGAKLPGFGSGGCVWAIGSRDNIDKTRHEWLKVLTDIPNATLLPVYLTNQGLKVKVVKNE